MHIGASQLNLGIDSAYINAQLRAENSDDFSEDALREFVARHGKIRAKFSPNDPNTIYAEKAGKYNVFEASDFTDIHKYFDFGNENFDFSGARSANATLNLTAGERNRRNRRKKNQKVVREAFRDDYMEDVAIPTPTEMSNGNLNCQSPAFAGQNLVSTGNIASNENELQRLLQKILVTLKNTDGPSQMRVPSGGPSKDTTTSS